MEASSPETQESKNIERQLEINTRRSKIEVLEI